MNYTASSWKFLKYFRNISQNISCQKISWSFTHYKHVINLMRILSYRRSGYVTVAFISQTLSNHALPLMTLWSCETCRLTLLSHPVIISMAHLISCASCFDFSDFTPCETRATYRCYQFSFLPIIDTAQIRTTLQYTCDRRIYEWSVLALWWTGDLALIEQKITNGKSPFYVVPVIKFLI